MHIQLINTLIPALQNIPEIYTKNEFSPKKSVSCSAFFKIETRNYIKKYYTN